MGSGGIRETRFVDDVWHELAGGRYGRSFALIRIDRSVVAHGGPSADGFDPPPRREQHLGVEAVGVDVNHVDGLVGDAEHVYILVPERRRPLDLDLVDRLRRLGTLGVRAGAQCWPRRRGGGFGAEDGQIFALPSRTGQKPTVYFPLPGRRASQTGATRRVKAGAGSGAFELVQRLLDVLLAGFALVLLLPLIALVALAIKLESRGSVFYRARRVGLAGNEFRMLKFRKMRTGVTGAPLTAADDERFTRMGRLLAKTKLDEVPQLWNVLTGSMSLVGPRPEDPQFVALRRAEYEPILAVKPGVTGLSQLAFAREMDVLDPEDRVGDYVRRLMPQKMAIDDLYARRRSIALYLRILWWTVVAVGLRKDVAVNRETGHLNLRRRPRRPRPESAQTRGVAS